MRYRCGSPMSPILPANKGPWALGLALGLLLAGGSWTLYSKGLDRVAATEPGRAGGAARRVCGGGIAVRGQPAQQSVVGRFLAQVPDNLTVRATA